MANVDDEPGASSGMPPPDTGGSAATDSNVTTPNGDSEWQAVEPAPADGMPPPDSGEPLPVEGPPAPPGFLPDGTTIPPEVPPEVPPIPPEAPPEFPPVPVPIPGGTAPEIPPTPPIPVSPNHDLPGVAGILSWLQNALQQVQDTVSKITSQISDSLAAMIESIVPPTVAAITGLASIMGELVQGLLNNLTSVPEYGQMLQDSITGGFPVAMADFWAHIWETRGDEINGLLEHLSANDALPDQYKSILSTARRGTPLILAPIAIGLGILVLARALDRAAEPELRFVEYTSNRGSPNRIPEHNELVEALFRGNIGNDRLAESLSMLGFGDEARGILVGNRYALIDVDRLLELWRRGVIDEPTVNAGLFQIGLQGDSAEQVKKLAPFLPSPSDLVHFMTRDAFWDDPSGPFGDIVHEFQLDFAEDNLPFDQFAKVGVSPEVVKWFWRSHWEIPGRHDANEMFFRGTLGDRSSGGDGERTLERVYRARGIEPRFIQPLIQTAFHPLGRIDIRRLVKSGQFDRDAAIEAYRQIGYNGDNATVLADLAIGLATQESAAEKEPFRSGLKARIVAAYISGLLSSTEASNALASLHYNTDAVSVFIAEADVERHAQTASHIRQGTQRLYASREWDADQTTKYLQSKGFADSEIVRLLEWWQPLRELSDLKAEHKSHKEATRADILAAFTDDVIDRDSASQHLLALGYVDSDIEMFLTLAEHRKTRQDITAQISGIQAAFEDRQTDIQAVIHELDGLGINVVRRNALLRKWIATLDKKQPDLPLAMVEKLALAKLYPQEELTNELRKRHFDQSQIDKFMRLWGYEIEVATTRERTRSDREVQAEQRRHDAEQRRIAAEQQRNAARILAEQRRHEADIRRAEADRRRADAEGRAARIASQREHDRMLRDAHTGRLAIGRIRTAFTLGIISDDSATTLMQAIGLRPETAELELEILHEQQRTKSTRTGSSSHSATAIGTTAATTT